jgi:hypothetical protein
MEAKFRILIHRNSESLHLKLLGDFDGGSARQLINIITNYRFKVGRIFVHTSGLNSVDPSGADLLRTKLKLDIPVSVNLVFTGEKAEAIAPDNSKTIA